MPKPPGAPQLSIEVDFSNEKEIISPTTWESINNVYLFNQTSAVVEKLFSWLLWLLHLA
jgi:hypothetical protein